MILIESYLNGLSEQMDSEHTNKGRLELNISVLRLFKKRIKNDKTICSSKTEIKEILLIDKIQKYQLSTKQHF